MQRYACTTTHERIEADQALPGCDYLCPECAGVLRVKKGTVRQSHFFHLALGASCRNRFKNTLHSLVQQWLIERLGASECTEECFFSDIMRIADVAYHKKRVVFEVQLSPMSSQEALERTYDYYRIGWHVIWILHAHSFGRSDASPFEGALEGIPHYFTDIGYQTGRLWDEGSYVFKGRRLWFTVPPVRQDLDVLEVESFKEPGEIVFGGKHSCLRDLQAFRKKAWSCHVKGDLLEDGKAIVQVPYEKASFSQTLRRVGNYLYFWYLRLIA